MGKNAFMDPDAATARQGLMIECRSSISELKRLRKSVRKWLNQVDQPVGDWDVVVTELVCNAVHATTRESLDLEMSVRTNEDGSGRVTCTVTNDGEWDLGGLTAPAAIDFVVARNIRPADNLPTGRGLRMVCALISGGMVYVDHGSTSVQVWLETPANDRAMENA